MKRPMIIPAVGIMSGIISAYYIDVDHRFLLLLGTTALVWIALGFFNNKIRVFGLLILFVVLGAFITNERLSEIIEVSDTRQYTFIGTVEEISSGSSSTRYVINLEQIEDIKTEGKVLLRYYNEGHSHEIGDRLKIKGIAKKPMPNTNPLFFNYRLHLLTEGISHIIDGDRSTIILEERSEAIGYWLRKNVTEYISSVYDTGLREENSRLMKGIVLGNSSYLDEEDLNLYRNLGISHLLAVSGLHIGIIAGSLIWVLSRLGIKRWLNIILSVAILFIYGYSIGFPPSASRGIALFSMLYLSKLINRPVDRFNLLAGCMFLLQLYNPLWIFNSGFQLSFGATAAIILLSDRIKALIYPLKGRIIDPVSATIAVNLGIAPIQAYWFNSFPLLALISNIIIVPLASGCLVLGMASLMARWLLPILDFLLDLQRNAAILIQRIPLDQIILPTPGIEGFVIYLTILAVFFNWRTIERLDLRIKKAIFVGLLMISIAQFLETTTNEELEIHFIDVGQGDSALIIGPFGNYLIDGGGSRLDDQDIGSRITLPYLLKNGISNLEAVFVSHNHEDHYKGILPVIDQLSIGAVYTNGVFNKELYEKVKQRNVPIYELHDGLEADLGEGTILKVLWPENKEYMYLNENENSLVFLLEYLGRRVLFTGDIEEIAEKKIGSSYDLDVDVLKVPHHGSFTSSSYKFLDKVKPEYSIISVGRSNLYGHPNPQVINRLLDIGSEVHRTDEMGMIKVIISRNDLEVIPFDYNRIKPSIEEMIGEYYIYLVFMALYLIASYYLVKDYIRRQGEIGWII